MILKSALQEVIDTQKKALTTRKLGVIREKLPTLENNSGMISVITGIRRCGKSTLSNRENVTLWYETKIK